MRVLWILGIEESLRRSETTVESHSGSDLGVSEKKRTVLDPRGPGGLWRCCGSKQWLSSRPETYLVANKVVHHHTGSRTEGDDDTTWLDATL